MAKAVEFTMDAKLDSARQQFSKLTREVERQEAHLKKLTSQANRAARNLDRAGQSTNSFGVSLGGLATKLAAIAGPAAIFAVIARNAAAAKAEIQAIGQEVAGAYDTMRDLWQISQGREHYERLSGQVKMAMAREGIPRQLAGALAFNLESLGKGAALPEIIKAARFMDPLTAAAYYTTVTSTGAWGAAAGGPQQVLSGLLEGARVSRFTAGQTADWMLRVAPQMAALGAKPSEVLAAGAVLSKSAANPEQLATFLRTMGVEIMRADVGGQGLLAGFEALRKDPKAYEKLRKTSKYFMQAAIPMERGWAEITALAPTIAEAIGTGAPFAAKVEQPPELTLERRRMMAEAQKSVALEEMARRQTELEIAINRAKTVAAMTGRSLAVEEFVESALQAGATFGQVEAATEWANQRLMDMLVGQGQAGGAAMAPLLGREGRRRLGELFPAVRTDRMRFGRGAGGEWGLGRDIYQTLDVPRFLTDAQAEAIGQALADALRERGPARTEEPLTTEAGAGNASPDYGE